MLTLALTMDSTESLKLPGLSHPRTCRHLRRILGVQITRVALWFYSWAQTISYSSGAVRLSCCMLRVVCCPSGFDLCSVSHQTPLSVDVVEHSSISPWGASKVMPSWSREPCRESVVGAGFFDGHSSEVNHVARPPLPHRVAHTRRSA